MFRYLHESHSITVKNLKLNVYTKLANIFKQYAKIFIKNLFTSYQYISCID